MNNTMKKAFLLFVFAAIVAGGAFAFSMAGCAVLLDAVIASIPSSGSDSSSVGSSGSRYEVVNTPLSWEDAKREAERRGGHLAVITSAEEHQTIVSMLAPRTDYWIGGYSEGNRVFRWVTGEPMTYTNWGSSQPDDGGPNMGMQLWSGINWQWDDTQAYNRKAFIIEWEQEQPTTQRTDLGLNGVWEMVGNGNGPRVMTISGSGAVINEFGTATTRGEGRFTDARNKGFIKVGDPFFRNIRTTGINNQGRQTWSCEVLRVTGPEPTATGTNWETRTIYMKSNGDIEINGVVTFRRR